MQNCDSQLKIARIQLNFKHLEQGALNSHLQVLKSAKRLIPLGFSWIKKKEAALDQGTAGDGEL